MKKEIQLSDHFTYGKLLRFTFPSIIMMIFTSIYGVVDGYFVSNYAGKAEFTAVNFIMPFLLILGAVGSMLGAGGSALISKTMGEGKDKEAKELFSLFILITVVVSCLFALGGLCVLRPVAAFLGAEGELLDNCCVYGRVILIALPAFMLQYEFQNFFVTAEKPQLGLYVTLAAGVSNMLLDWLLVAVFPMGLVGAALATSIAQCIGGIVPLLYFAGNNSSRLKLVRPVFNAKALLKACGNGSSELLTNISMSLVSMLYNAQLLKYAGEDGVAAYGVLMYVNLIFLAAFIGYSVGTAPVIGYHYGAANHGELRSLLGKSLRIIAVFSLAMLAAAELLARPLALIFVSYDEDLLALTLRGFLIFSFSFLFAGLAIFGSSFFTALNDGLVSAAISFLRTLVFQVAAVLIFPLLWGVDGIWISCVAAELMAALLTTVFLLAKRKKYHY